MNAFRSASLGLAAALAGLGAVFFASPRTGASLFGLTPPSGDLDYVRALAFRDWALSAGLAGTALLNSPRTTGRLAVAFALVPALDAVLVGRRRGASAALQLCFHLSGAAALLALAAFSRRER